MTQDSGWNTGGDPLAGGASSPDGTPAAGSHTAGAGAAGEPAGQGGAWASPAQDVQPHGQQQDQPYGSTYGQPYGGAYDYGYGQPGYPPAWHYGYRPPRQTNVLAIVAIALCVPVCLVGMILGFVARKQIQDTGEDGDGIALAAIIVGACLTGLYVLFFVGYIAIIWFSIAAAIP